MPKGGHTMFGNHADLSRRKTNGGIRSFNRHKLSKRSGSAYNLPTLSWLQLNVINFHAYWDVFEFKTISCLNFSFLQRRNDRVSYSKSNGGNNITFFSISIMKECQSSTTIWIVFYRSHDSRNIKLIALKIHESDS